MKDIMDDHKAIIEAVEMKLREEPEKYANEDEAAKWETIHEYYSAMVNALDYLDWLVNTAGVIV